MRLLIQRVTEASVSINGICHSAISQGLLVFVGIENGDDNADIAWLVGKVLQLRIFDDVHGVPNCSVADIKGELLVVSQFTLHASTKKGNRPGYSKAAPPETANQCYERFVEELRVKHSAVKTGVFGADMQVSLINDGPLTIWIDSKQKE
jgi:D-aminoacyl-tRNA deacylase